VTDERARSDRRIAHANHAAKANIGRPTAGGNAHAMATIKATKKAATHHGVPSR
jgi:hypothetical protein